MTLPIYLYMTQIIILTTFDTHKYDLSLEYCNDIFELYTCILLKYTKMINNVSLNIIKYDNKITNIIKKGDHLIIMGDMILSKMTMKIMDELRTYILGKIISISYSTNRYLYEDITYYINPDTYIINEKSVCIGYLYEESIHMTQEKINKYFIIGEKSDISENIIKIIKDKFNGDFIIKQLNGMILNTLDIEGNLIESHTLTIYELYSEFKKASHFFVTKRQNNYMLLSDISHCGVIILAPKNYIDPHTVSYLNIYTYDDLSLVNFDDIHDKKRDIQRWDQIINKIMEYLLSNTHKINNDKNIIETEGNKKRRIKKKILLQSMLR